ncbi:M20 family metallopeptidase [Anaerospora hongkongensis]|uniref:M20 family metallopeptidase n=1 Tax=Anaerospora hongkongensis TaxID=244830 RepID=UPI0028968C11|nr:M20 family metallopeptidase [Anaerospora hongkongensis]
MTGNSKLTKEKVCNDIDKIKDELLTISHYLCNNPEVGFQEYKAAQALTDSLRNANFKVESGVCCLETAFIGSYGQGMPTIAFVAEYDALPMIGHACGHNLIASAALGAAIGLSKVMGDKLCGTVKVIGTPAEENGSGKIVMLQKGAFVGVDVAMMLHPNTCSMADDISYATRKVEFTFHGRAAHAAVSPWSGTNALNGVIQMFNLVDSMRLHVKDYARIHGIITDGGVATNIIPETAQAVFSIRALNSDYLEELVAIVRRCAQGAAIGTGTTFTDRVLGSGCLEVRNNKILVNLLQSNFTQLGEPIVERAFSQGIGATDMGNVTHEIPAIHGNIGLGEGLVLHTKEFAEKAASPAGDKAIITAAKVMAMTAVDILADPTILCDIKKHKVPLSNS